MRLYPTRQYPTPDYKQRPYLTPNYKKRPYPTLIIKNDGIPPCVSKKRHYPTPSLRDPGMTYQADFTASLNGQPLKQRVKRQAGTYATQKLRVFVLNAETMCG